MDKKSKYFKAKIVKCSNKDYWYKNVIGTVILVKELDWPSAYFEAKIGEFGVLRSDVRPVSSSKLKEFGRYYEN